VDCVFYTLFSIIQNGFLLITIIPKVLKHINRPLSPAYKRPAVLPLWACPTAADTSFNYKSNLAVTRGLASLEKYWCWSCTLKSANIPLPYCLAFSAIFTLLLDFPEWLQQQLLTSELVIFTANQTAIFKICLPQLQKHKPISIPTVTVLKKKKTKPKSTTNPTQPTTLKTNKVISCKTIEHIYARVRQDVIYYSPLGKFMAILSLMYF